MTRHRSINALAETTNGLYKTECVYGHDTHSWDDVNELESANAIFDYLEIFHNRQRRHSSLGMLSLVEYERRHADNPARVQAS